MKKLLSAIFVSAILFAPSAFAQFSSSQSSAELTPTINSEIAKGKSLADVAAAALKAGVDAGTLTTAMLKSALPVQKSSVPLSIVALRALLLGGDFSRGEKVIRAALAAGVSEQHVLNAASLAGIEWEDATKLIYAAKKDPFSISLESVKLTGTPRSNGNAGGGSPSRS